MDRTKGVDVAPALEVEWDCQNELSFRGGKRNYVDVYVDLHLDKKRITEDQMRYINSGSLKIYCYKDERYMMKHLSKQAGYILIHSALEYEGICMRLHFQ